MDDNLKLELVNRFIKDGSHKFYKSLLSTAIKICSNDNLEKENKIDTEFLSISEKFLFLYRAEGDEMYLEISKIFRKAAHKIYRLLLKKHLTKKNNKFLNLV